MICGMLFIGIFIVIEERGVGGSTTLSNTLVTLTHCAVSS